MSAVLAALCARRRSLLPLLGLFLAACGAAEPAPRPGVILVSLDTLRADHLGLYGYARDTSPGLDRLAGESLVFERAFTTAAWTLPAHMSMLTGLHNHEHGVVERHAALAPEIPLLAERLRAEGYQTIGLYNVSPIRPEHGFGRGFDVFRSHTGAAEAGRHLEEELARLDPERPFFLFLHLFDIHNGPLGEEPGPIYDCPPPYDEMFLPGARERLPKLPEREILERGLIRSAEELAALVALYDGGIRHVDDELAAWMEAWRARGLLANSLLVVTADHGESLGQHGATRGHGAPYQEGLRVPLLLRHPGGLRAGEREATPVQLTDLVPTILSFAGLAPEPSLPGVSLLGSVPARRKLLALEAGKYEVIVDWPVKWTHLLGDGELSNVERWFRHDLAADPGETAELSLTPQEFKVEKAALRAGTTARFPRPVRVEWSDEELERMRGLGYAGHPGATAESGGELAPEDWPCWRGARGDGLARSTDWIPEGTRLWSRDVGLGHSSPSVVGKRLYTLGFDAEKELDTVFCLSTETGETIWSTSNHGLRIAFDYHDGGTLSTPAVAGERVYVTSSAGQLRALDAATGAVLWERSVAREVRGKPDAFGFSVSPVVRGDDVLVCMDRVVCVDARTGEIRWATEPLGANHSTPTLFELRSEKRLAVFGAREMCVLDPADGRQVYSYPWFEGHVGKNVATPVAVGERIFVSSGQDRGCAMLEFDAEARAVWASRVMRNVMAGCVLVDRHLYGFDESVLKCIDLDGKELWRERGLGNGSLSAAGDRLVLTSSKGELIVADASPEGYRERWRQPLFDEGTFWSPPVFAGGRIFTRSSLGKLVCTDHRPGATQEAAPETEAAAATTTAPSPALPDARSLFARHLELVGGAERVRKPRSIRWRGQYELRSMGVRSTTVEIQQLAPDLRREEIQFPRGDPSKVIRVFDGEVAYELNRVQGNRILDEDAQREARQTSGLYAAADWESAYASVQTVGLVEFADRPAYRVEARLATGPAPAPAASRSVYFDVATGFLLGRAGETEAIVIHDDWRAFDGLRLPMFEKRFLPGSGVEETLRFQEVVFDDVTPEVFARPAEIQALLDER